MNPVLAFSLILCVLVPRLSFGEDFLVRKDGSRLTQEVHDTDPASITVKWWEIHYYWHDRDWGASTSKTYDGLMKTIETSQRFDQMWAKAINADVESFENHMHPGRPIAVVENGVRTDTDDPLHMLEKAQDLIDGYNDIAEAYNSLMGNWEKVKAKEGGAMENVGKVFAEYTDNFKDAFKKLTNLQEHLGTLWDVTGLETAFYQFQNSVNQTERLHDSAQEELNNATRDTPIKWSQWTNDTQDSRCRHVLGIQRQGGHYVHYIALQDIDPNLILDIKVWHGSTILANVRSTRYQADFTWSYTDDSET